MKFSCEKAKLQAAINTASRATSVKSAVPALEGLLLESGRDLKISGYDLKTGIVTSVDADTEKAGSIVLNSRLFCDIVRSLPNDIVTVDSDETYMTKISCGAVVFNIMGTSSEDYPELPAVEGQNYIMMKQSTMKAMISQTNFAVSDNEIRPIHTGSLFEVTGDELTVVSVDGYRLALRCEKIDEKNMDDTSFVIPGAALSEVEKILIDSEEMVKITLGTKHIMFTIGDTVLISRRLEGEFLNYRQALPKESKYSIKADRRTLISCVERVSLIISDKLKSPVRCIFGDSTLRVQTVTALGKAYDECVIDGNGNELEIGFNNRYLLDALKAAPADSVLVQLSTNVSPCIIVPESEEKNFLYMILPVRLRANEG